jgi:DNA repair exonuclease SbcCD nuclease subunit
LQSFRFVHAADLHIDSPFRGLRDVDKRVGERLRESTFEAFRNLVDLCVDEQVDFLVIAGDIYDGADRSVRAQLRFRDGMRRLSEAGVAVYIVHGNHDPLDGWLSAIEWPEGIHVFGPEPEWKTVELNGEPLAAIQGVSFPTREVRENLVARFTTPTDVGNDSLFTIGLLHCNVGGNPDHDNYAPCTLDDLKLTALDYWALGHVHTRQTLRRQNPAVIYPGNLQGRHPNENGPRGCLMVEVSEEGSINTRFHALDVVRWEPTEVDISDIDTLDKLEAAVQQKLDDLSVKAEGRDVICSLTLSGRGKMHAEFIRPSAIEDLLVELRATASESPWVWVERIETRPSIDLDARSDADDFLGATLRHSTEVLQEPEGVQELAGVVGDLFTGRKNALPAPTDEQIRDWASEARWELAELLEPEE